MNALKVGAGDARALNVVMVGGGWLEIGDMSLGWPVQRVER
jgi:hypothetical protein